MLLSSRLDTCRMCEYTEPNLNIDGNRIDTVNHLPHLGHIIDCQCNDSAASINGRNSLTGQIINVLCIFKNVHTVVKVKLMKAYCSSLYGGVL